jgi:TAT (twin-arginine translocation) pathway signal sequence
MSDLSRRNFLAHGAAAAGAVVVVGQLGDGTASADSPGAGAEPAWFGGEFGAEPTTSEPFVVYIRDAAKGEVAVLRGEEEIVYTDRALVGRLQRAMRRAAW